MRAAAGKPPLWMRNACRTGPHHTALLRRSALLPPRSPRLRLPPHSLPSLFTEQQQQPPSSAVQGAAGAFRGPSRGATPSDQWNGDPRRVVTSPRTRA
ncbi:unnamed protein product [Lampetra fluviatilis]